MTNHYHILGYLKEGEALGQMMRKLHVSVAKLTNDVFEMENKERLLPFWRTGGQQDYFDGCLRDEKQYRKTYKYVLEQSMRHRICKHWHDYPHTKVNIELERALKRSLDLKAFMFGVPYKRYLDKGKS